MPNPSSVLLDEAVSPDAAEALGSIYGFLMRLAEEKTADESKPSAGQEESRAYDTRDTH